MISRTIVIVALLFTSCETEKRLAQNNLFDYSQYNKDYFPDAIQERLDTSTHEYFNSDYYTKILRRLGESSLSEAHPGKDILRLTVIRTFRNHFTIRIEKTTEGIVLIEKETYRNSFSWIPVDSLEAAIGEHIDFDSTKNTYVKIRMKYFMHSDSSQELSREIIDPIVKAETEELGIEKWNELVDLLNTKKFYSMRTPPGPTGFDGNHFLIETASKEGYFVVDRWSPPNDDFMEIVSFITALVKRLPED